MKKQTVSFSEILIISLKALMVNRTRSFLTTLGIIIGIAAVITAFAAGRGANGVIDRQIAMLGSNFMYIFEDRDPSSRQSKPRYITLSDARAIERECSGASAVAPLAEAQVNAVCGSSSCVTTASGSNAAFSAVREWVIAKGRDLTDQDVRSSAKVCVLGVTVAEKLFGDETPIGKVIRLRSTPFTVVGVFKKKGQTQGGWDQDDFILAPHTAIRRHITRSSGTDRIDAIAVKGASMKGLKQLEQQIAELLRERHRIKPGARYDFRIHNIGQILETRRRSTQTMSLLLGTVAVISLIVGGIGIMNIMLVSVTERTKEIGIRMAVGAKARDIRLQFLMESMILSLIGGAFGILLGIAASIGLAKVMQAPPVFGADSVLLAFFFSASIGIAFGLYPAWRASSLNPIDALKYE